MCLNPIRKFWSEGAICSGFPCLHGALRSWKGLLICASLLPKLHPKGTGEAFAFTPGHFCTQKTSEIFAQQDLKFSLLSEFPSQSHCQVIQIHQGRLPRKPLSSCPLGDGPTTSLQFWLARHLFFPTPSIRLHHHLLMHLKKVRGLGHNTWLELMPEG